MAPIIDSQGRCPSHPFVQLQRLSPRTNEWKALLDSCPLCVMDNKSTTSSVCSSVCSALILNDDDEHDDDNGQQAQQGGGQVAVESNPFVVSSRGRQHSLPIESSSSHHHTTQTPSSRGRQQSLPIDAAAQPIRRSRSNSRVRFSPPTTTILDESGLLGALAIDQRPSSSSKFVRQSSSSSLSALGHGNNNGGTVDPLTSLTICGSVSSHTTSSLTTVEPKSALKLPRYKVCPLQMKQQLDDSERVTTMSMDLNIEDDVSSTQLNYYNGGGGEDMVNDNENNDDDQGGRG